jgi:hypothetical protein
LSDARLPVGCTWRASSGENSRGLNPISLATGLPSGLFGFAQTTSMAIDASLALMMDEIVSTIHNAPVSRKNPGVVIGRKCGKADDSGCPLGRSIR